MNHPEHRPQGTAGSTAGDLDHYWLPFTPNRYFQEHPKLMTSARGA